MIWRSWIFKVYSIMILLFIVVYDCLNYLQTSDYPICFHDLLLNNYSILSSATAFIVFLFGIEVVIRDKSFDTSEVLFTYSASNLEFILGKAVGICIPFLLMEIMVFIVSLIIGSVSSVLHVDILMSFEYMLIIGVPTVIFCAGLSLFCALIISSRSLSLLLLLGISAFILLYGSEPVNGLFDFFCFRLPVIKSDISGYADLDSVISQRLMYLFLGTGLTFASVLIFSRLPQSKRHTESSTFFAVLFCSLAILFCCRAFILYKVPLNEKQLVIATNRLYEDEQFASITSSCIDLYHKGDELEAMASLIITNDNLVDIDHYIFSLNPGLSVNSIKSGNDSLPFNKVNHIYKVFPVEKLGIGESDSITVTYSGTVKQSFCYPWEKNNRMINTENGKMEFLKSSFLSEDYVLLTPESHWYPTFGLNYYPSNPAKNKIDFTVFKLRVTTRNELVPASQGGCEINEGRFVFEPNEPLTGLTLAIGRYKVDTLSAGGILFYSYYYPGHDYYKDIFEEISDTLPSLVTQLVKNMETRYTSSYPFKTLSFVETPTIFGSVPKPNSVSRADVQPALVLLPERLSSWNLPGANFENELHWYRIGSDYNKLVLTDKELKVRMFNFFVTSTFMTGQHFVFTKSGAIKIEPLRYRLDPDFYLYKNNFSSEQYPIFNNSMESYFQKTTVQMNESDKSFKTAYTLFETIRKNAGITGNDKANLILRNKSLEELLALSPDADIVASVLSVKGEYIYKLLKAASGDENFDNWFRDYREKNRFIKISLDSLDFYINNRFGLSIYKYLDDWYHSDKLPGFFISGVNASEIIVENRTRYHVEFTVSNPEPVAGVVEVYFLNVVGEPDYTTDYILGPQETKKVGILLNFKPVKMTVNTILSKNLPREISFLFNDIKVADQSIIPYLGEAIQPAAKTIGSKTTIIDNEDKGFTIENTMQTGFIQKFLETKSTEKPYGVGFIWNRLPMEWTPVLLDNSYGDYIKSSVYVASNEGASSISWTVMLKSPGYYNIYCYIGKGKEYKEANAFRKVNGKLITDLHYTILTDNRSEEIKVDFNNMDEGWHKLGQFYLSDGFNKVSLSNRSSGMAVIGDAIKWEKIE